MISNTLDTDANSIAFLNKDTTDQRRQEIVKLFLALTVPDITNRWINYFKIENKDREKFWEKVIGLPAELKTEFINSARHLTNNEKIDLHSKTPEKYRDILAKEIIPKIGPKSAKKPLIAVIAAYLVFLLAINIMFLLPIMTADIPKDENLIITSMNNTVAVIPSNHIVSYNFGTMKGETMDIDTHFVFLVVLAGSLGALIHGLAKLSHNTWDGIVKQREALWYLSRPFLGAALAIAVYAVFRGGLLTTSNVEILNPYGMAAISIIVGLSTKQVTEKLKDMLDSVFPTKKPEEEPEVK